MRLKTVSDVASDDPWPSVLEQPVKFSRGCLGQNLMTARPGLVSPLVQVL